MIRKDRIFDPEVSALVKQMRTILGATYQLSRDIDQTLDDLNEHVATKEGDESDD